MKMQFEFSAIHAGVMDGFSDRPEAKPSCVQSNKENSRTNDW